MLSLATAQQSTKRHVVALSSCSPVGNEARKTALCRAACCRDFKVALGLAICVYISQATGRHCDNVPFACFAYDRRQDDSATTRRNARFASDKTKKGDNDIGCVVAIDNATRKVYQISHHRMDFRVKHNFHGEVNCLHVYGKKDYLNIRAEVNKGNSTYCSWSATAC
jgi:hypothetical protein